MNSSKRINTQPESIINSDEAIFNTEEAQKKIYCFLSDIVKQLPPEGALQEFKRLFIEHNDTIISEPVAEVYEIVISNNQAAFYHTIKRCCYILINNWKLDRNHQYIQKLIEVFASPIIAQRSLSPTINQLRRWLKSFISSRDYQELKLFAAKFEIKDALSSRYSSNLLVAQSTNTKNPVEQREAAQHRAKQLNYRYKFDLAMYMAGSQSAIANKKSNNLDGLPDNVMHLIKTIVAKRNPATYTTIANVFLEQNKNVKYKEFKKDLQNYLIFSTDKQDINVIREDLANKLASLYQKEHEKMLTDELVLKTCSKLINYLTIENYHEPSGLFILLMSQGNPLTLVIVLLKIILVCRASRPHLETCIAGIIRYYEDASEENRKRAVNFLEIYNIMIAIYADNLPVKLN